jgi:hypothetical protein
MRRAADAHRGPCSCSGRCGGAAEDALLDATARNSAILRAVPDLMFVVDRDGTYLDYHARGPVPVVPPRRRRS